MVTVDQAPLSRHGSFLLTTHGSTASENPEKKIQVPASDDQSLTFVFLNLDI